MTKTSTAIQIQLSDITLNQGTFDPSVAGLSAAIGSKYWRGTATSGDWTKTGAGNTAWAAVPTGIYFNVKDPAYGATGDGTTDDRAAIQLAINDAAVAGGTVYFPSGTYLCGKSGANPYSFLIDNVDNLRFLGCGWGGSTIKQSGNAGAGAYNLFRIQGGSSSTEFELLTLDGSGVSNVGTDADHMFLVTDAIYVKWVSCRFTGAVANTGAYVKLAASAGKTVSAVWITDCDMRDAGGPIIWMEGGVSNVWVLDSDLVQTTSEDNTILIKDTVGMDITDIRVMNNHIENPVEYGIQLGTTATLSRIAIANNLILGWLKCAGATKSLIQHNEIYASVAVITDPVALLSACTITHFQKNIVGRASTCADGLVFKGSTCDKTPIQGNIWIQETTGATSGIGHLLDSTNVQIQNNVCQVTDAGASVAIGWLVESVGVISDNIIITGENLTSDTGTWLDAVSLSSNGAAIANVSITGSILDNCATGILLNDNGGGSAVFTGLYMLGGNAINASTAAYTTPSGVYIRIGSNASTFGAQIIAGNGSPLNNVTARIGSLYQRLDGGANTTLYVKESATNATGWVAK